MIRCQSESPGTGRRDWLIMDVIMSIREWLIMDVIMSIRESRHWNKRLVNNGCYNVNQRVKALE